MNVRPTQRPGNAPVNLAGQSAAVAAGPVQPGKKRGGKKVLKWVLVVLVVAALAFFAWKYVEAQQELKRLSNPEAAAQESTRRLVDEVGRLIELPSNETPTVATVVDAGKIKEQPFFAKAENDDKVLIYTQNRKAILYRPSTKKIIEVAPINIGNTGASTQ